MLIASLYIIHFPYIIIIGCISIAAQAISGQRFFTCQICRISRVSECCCRHERWSRLFLKYCIQNLHPAAKGIESLWNPQCSMYVLLVFQRYSALGAPRSVSQLKKHTCPGKISFLGTCAISGLYQCLEQAIFEKAHPPCPARICEQIPDTGYLWRAMPGLKQTSQRYNALAVESLQELQYQFRLYDFISLGAVETGYEVIERTGLIARKSDFHLLF